MNLDGILARNFCLNQVITVSIRFENSKSGATQMKIRLKLVHILKLMANDKNKIIDHEMFYLYYS